MKKGRGNPAFPVPGARTPYPCLPLKSDDVSPAFFHLSGCKKIPGNLCIAVRFFPSPLSFPLPLLPRFGYGPRCHAYPFFRKNMQGPPRRFEKPSLFARKRQKISPEKGVFRG